MVRPSRRLAVLLASAALSACLPVEKGENPDLAGQTVRLTVLHTADIHSRLLPYDLAPLKTDSDLGLSPEAPPYGGVARLASLIRRERTRSDRSILLDSGDCFQGAPIFNANDGEAEVRWMSLMGYDGVVIGNHEFDKGAHNFADKAARFGSYPLLAANYLWESPTDPNAHGLDKLSAPYTITNVRGVRVGVLGMANISSLNSIVEGGNSLQATPLEQNEVARAWVEFLKPVVDLVVVVSHLGLSEDQELVTGYDAYYPYENAKPFLERARDPWTQLEPPEPGKTFLDGTVRVFIPGVQGIDLIEGGHLHVVLNPPQVIRDVSGRPVIISHSGAFAKYLGRLDLEVEMPPKRPDAAPDSAAMRAWEARAAEGAEIVAHDYKAFPVDAVWCDEEAHSWTSQVPFGEFGPLVLARPKAGDCRQRFWEALPAATARECLDKYDRDFRDFDCDRFLPDDCTSRVERCAALEDQMTVNLLQPYILGLDETFALPRIFAFAPKDIARRNSSTGGDSPLGNMTAESMRVRRRVEAELALTNTLGIRDNVYAGPITLEGMFNVFPFENTINIMVLSGAEVQELYDFVASRSSDRGCQSQAQVSGTSFVMDCAQAQRNEERLPCAAAADCEPHGRPGHPDGWQCTEEQVCWAHASFDIVVNGAPLNPLASYKIAVNDYIAKGGSGFKVLKRNTTRIETGISLRDSLIDWLRGQCTCTDILATGDDGDKRSAAGFACARSLDGDRRVVDPMVRSYCETATRFQDTFDAWLLAGRPGGRLEGAPALFAGKCTCQDVINGEERLCGHVTRELKSYCSSPTRVPIAVGEEDGRIGRRVR